MLKGNRPGCSAWVPVTHASVSPFRIGFQTAAVGSLAVGRIERPRTRETCISLPDRRVATLDDGEAHDALVVRKGGVDARDR